MKVHKGFLILIIFPQSDIFLSFVSFEYFVLIPFLIIAIIIKRTRFQVENGFRGVLCEC